MTGGSLTTLLDQELISGGFIAGHDYTIDAQVTGTSPTTLTATLFDQHLGQHGCDDKAPLTDSTAGLQVSGQARYSDVGGQAGAALEVITYGPAFVPAASDNVNVGEMVGIVPLTIPLISVSDGMTVGEVSSAGSPFEMAAFTNEALLITDASSIEISTSLSVADGMALAESASEFVGFPIIKTESISVGEIVAFAGIQLVPIAVSESILTGDTWEVNVDYAPSFPQVSRSNT